MEAIEIGTLIGLFGCLIGFAGWLQGNAKAARSTGAREAAIETTLKHMQQTLDELKTDMRKRMNTMQDQIDTIRLQLASYEAAYHK
ncbi:hypothetical protein FACS1894184_21320 [Clostridia bacterium]|nr:hypothetical protein FACS1894184_21320 [Clostridia bacterium]